MDRILRRRWWFAFLLLTGVGAVLAGREWLFENASCARLQELILYITTGAGVVLAFIYALTTRDDSLVARLLSAAFQFTGILVVALVSGSLLVGMPEVRQVTCPEQVCDQAQLARSLREDGKFDGAEDVARACLARVASGAAAPTCEGECGVELALALFEKAGQALEALPAEWGADSPGFCQAAASQLNEALQLAERFRSADLTRSIRERQQRAAEKCVPPTSTPVPPTPTPMTPTLTPTPDIQLEVLRRSRGEAQAVVDVRVLEHGRPRAGLGIGDFTLQAGGQPVTFTLEARAADDPVCLIAVVDNSGSIYPGREQIRAALRKLNDLRKPGDELGLVLFAGRDAVRIEQAPAPEPLDANLVSGNGQLTALWDGMLEGLVAAQACSAKNRYLLVLTDGADNDSRRLEGDQQTKARMVATLAAQQGVDICSVGVQSEALDPKVLEIAASRCGYHGADSFDALAAVFANLFGYVRDFYRLTLAPAAIPTEQSLRLSVLQTAEVTLDFPKP